MGLNSVVELVAQCGKTEIPVGDRGPGASPRPLTKLWVSDLEEAPVWILAEMHSLAMFVFYCWWDIYFLAL